MALPEKIHNTLTRICTGNKCSRLLVDAKPGISLSLTEGFTFLHVAAWNGHWKCLQLFLANGLAVNMRSKTLPWTPLHAAAWTGEVICLHILIQNGGDIEAQVAHGLRPIHLASINGHIECIQTLLNHNAEINSRTVGAQTALHFATCKQQVRTMQILLEMGADINASGCDGHTALHSSAGRGYDECIRLLLQHGADKTITNNDGETALDIAIVSEQDIVIELLTESQESCGNLSQIPCTKCSCPTCVTDGNCIIDRQHLQERQIKELTTMVTSQEALNKDLRARINTLEDHKLGCLGFAEPSASVFNDTAMVSQEYLSPKMKKVLAKENLDFVSEMMNPRPVVDEMWGDRALSQEQYEKVNCLIPSIMKAKYLLGLTREGPKYLQALRDALRKTGQTALAQRLE